MKHTLKSDLLRPAASPRRVLRSRNRAALCYSGLLLGVAALLVLAADLTFRKADCPNPESLSELLALQPARMAEVPLARRNLLCATGLSSSSEPAITACDATLQTWAARIRSETQRHRYRFERDPAQFENSEGYFHMLMLCVVLTEDFRIHYDEERRAGPAATRPDDGFFGDPSSIFLHGLLGPVRKGTCRSIPVLYVAVGRRLGYPLKLVTTRGHLFVRWDGRGERFNVEATAHGLSRFSDDYYRHWPVELNPGEEAAEGYLKSLSAPEELAAFLSIRGMCLREQARLPEALESFAAAVRFAPGCRSYSTMLHRLQAALAQQATLPELTLETAGHNAPK